MRAIHLPSVPSGQVPPFNFPDNPASPSDLRYTAAGYPEPVCPSSASEHMYLVRVLLTALTRGELTWQEILDPSRFQPHGGAIPGHDVVGVIEKVFPSSKSSAEAKFSRGDQIWALLDFDRDGAAAEYTLAKETELSLVPKKTHANGLTGYQALFTYGGLPLPTASTAAPSKRVLILGAAGTVGLPTLQLAKAANMTVIATASAASSDLIASLLDPSTDTLLDYTSPGYVSVASSFRALNLPPVDLVVDCIGGETLSSLLLTTTPPLSPIIHPSGSVITVAAPLEVHGGSTSAQITKNCASAGVAAGFFVVKPSGEQLDTLGGWVRKGKLTGYVQGEKAFRLGDGELAMQVAEARGRKGGGKVVVRVVTQ
ncbi:hypothetical protein A1O7_08047 [Cladophialophora yegresii CBS 114405]|uniref:Enoyl reductase (ER) domain-containing protein n=1 Tax=Cladophialophora yegresii CBS 114405 TaxID=1182544 RepID=W9VHJ5_9EURO|nr:uncharacterized protein A1O7_08047 [Cladophialophora yegresii CBS 114405]EXJ55122.1 hypothetical protein A1O7_08047 [Cladophialophora yegresii CBS 114405]